MCKESARRKRQGEDCKCARIARSLTQGCKEGSEGGKYTERGGEGRGVASRGARGAGRKGQGGTRKCAMQVQGEQGKKGNVSVQGECKEERARRKVQRGEGKEVNAGTRRAAKKDRKGR